MPDAVIFQIEMGLFALALVDKTEVGYSDTWQAPGGKSVDTVTEADYDVGSATWKCQVISGALTATPDTTTQDIPATFCNPAKSIPTPAETAFNLDASFLQDPNVVGGLSSFLFEFDTEEAYFLLGMDGVNPPKAIGRVRVQAGAIGGAARTQLTADVSLPCSQKPQIMFGNATGNEIIPPTVVPLATGTAGTPGTWTGAAPASAAALTGAPAGTYVASPTTAWTTGQYVDCVNLDDAFWTGTAWAAGMAP